MRKLNYAFYPEPVVLLNIPEFGRFFNGTVLGNFYKQLRIRIFRKGVSSLKFKSDGYLTKLAMSYDKGNLCCYITDEELAEILGDMDIRSVAMKRKELIELKLIKVFKLGTGQYIYELGKRLNFKDEEGYDTGEESESFYIDSWTSRVSHGDVEDNALHPETIAFRIWLTEKLAPDAKKQKILEKLRKVFQEVTKNFSKKEPPQTPEKPAPRQLKTAVTPAPIVDISYNNNKKDKRSLVQEEMSETLFSEPLVDSKLEDLKTKMDKEVSAEGTLALSYQLAKAGMEDREVKTLLNKKFPNPEAPRYPRFSLAAKFRPEKESPMDSIVRLYSALFYDAHGAFENVGKSRKIAKNLTETYSLKQIVWSIRKVLSGDKIKDVQFMLSGIHTLQTVVRNNALEYAQFEAHEAKLKAYRVSTHTNSAPEEDTVPHVELTDEERQEILRKLKRG